jgi:hypothetical protein
MKAGRRRRRRRWNWNWKKRVWFMYVSEAVTSTSEIGRIFDDQCDLFLILFLRLRKPRVG